MSQEAIVPKDSYVTQLTYRAYIATVSQPEAAFDLTSLSLTVYFSSLLGLSLFNGRITVSWTQTPVERRRHTLSWGLSRKRTFLIDCSTPHRKGPKSTISIRKQQGLRGLIASYSPLHFCIRSFGYYLCVERREISIFIPSFIHIASNTCEGSSELFTKLKLISYHWNCKIRIPVTREICYGNMGSALLSLHSLLKLFRQ